jgi:hypothetical protein
MTLRPRHLALLLPFLLTGCIFHKMQPHPVQAFAPPASSAPRPETVHPDLPDSTTILPPEPLLSADDASLSERPVSHHQHPYTRPPQPAASVPPATQAADPPAVSAIGQLSTGEPSDLRLNVKDSIASTENGLNNIGRSLYGQDQKTAGQIRKFLKQAKDALNNGDVDGAKTLASKAKVLLSELSH